MKALLVVMLLWGTAQAGFAAEQTPAFMHPEVLAAAVAMNLSDEQKPRFQQALTQFYNDRIKAVNLLLRRNNQTNVPRKIKGKTNALLKKMDKQMAGVLTDEQLPAYENYRKLLKSNMQGM